VATQGGTEDPDVGVDAEAAGPLPDAASVSLGADSAESVIRENSEIWEKLEQEPFCFNFFQAVRLLERLMPDRQPVGHFTQPAREVARFGAYPSVSFPASQVQSLTSKSGEPVRMAVNFMA